MKITKTPVILQDIQAQSYLGIEFTTQEVKGYLEICKKNIPNFDTYNKNLLARNLTNGDYPYHLTIFNTKEFVKNKYLNFNRNFEIDLLGVGVSNDPKDKTNFTIYIVCNSSQLTEFRVIPKDFHITLGFVKKDIFTVCKNIISYQ